MPVVNGLDLGPGRMAAEGAGQIRDNPATCWWCKRKRSRLEACPRPGDLRADDSQSEGQRHRQGGIAGEGRRFRVSEADRVFFGPNCGSSIEVTGNDPGSVHIRITMVVARQPGASFPAWTTRVMMLARRWD